MTAHERLLRVDECLLQSFLHEPWKHYHELKIAKPDGRRRTLFIPSEPLKAVQRQLLRTELARIPKHENDHCRSGRSVLTNAHAHLHHGYVSAYDIEQCFPSLTPRLVASALQQYGMAPERARLITGLTTYRGQLPQGTPTSSALLSAVLRPLDVALTEAARAHNVTYTRYADDLFVSGNKPLGFFRREVLCAVSARGLRLAHDKTINWTPRRRARLAGVILASKPTIDPEYVQSVRGLIHLVVNEEVALSKSEYDSLMGKIAWIEQLRPVCGRRLRRDFLRERHE